MKIKTLAMLAGLTVALSACASSDVITTEDGDMYRIKDGENLMIIGEREYGSRSAWRKIYEANMDTIEDPAMVFPGQMIVLPE